MFVENARLQSVISGMTPQQDVESFPPHSWIVQLTNSDTLRFRNWSFTINNIQHFFVA